MDFAKLLKSNRVVVFDGAMGTALALLRNPQCPNHNYQTNSKLQIPNERCSEELNLIAPELIRKVHEDFLKAGAQVIETNTFGANRIVLAEHGLADKVREINLAAVRIAKEAIKIPPHPPFLKGGRGGLQSRFISASIGPTSKLPTLGHIMFNKMVDAYREQAECLLEGGVDIFQIETCQDILQAKAAVIGCKKAMKNNPPSPPFRKGGTGGILPIIVTITVEPSGTTLLGTEIGAALSALAPLGISAFGLNCATGPAEMEEHVKYLSKNSPLPIAILPNAGLPEISDGVAHYPLGPEEFAKWAAYFVNELGVKIIGGCCGTTPGHIKAVAAVLASRRLCAQTPTRQHANTISVSSLYTAVSIDQEPRPLIVGERMNINGSKEFREYILKGDFDSATQMAKRQAESGAHVLDLSVAYAGRDEVSDMREMARRLATASPLPIMVDSINPLAIEASLSHLGGRSIINSINLEDGGKKARNILEIAERHGSALVALTIDEDGMAMTAKKKLSIAERLIKLCKSQTLFIDFLTFTLADPKAAEFGSALETLKALKLFKQIPPHPPLLKGGRGGLSVRTILGVSNISYGLKPDARRVLNSIFLHEAVKSGLSAAIVHAGQILPLHKIDKNTAKLAADLIYCRRKDALTRFVEHFEGKKEAGSMKHEVRLPAKEQLKRCIIDGNKTGLSEAIQSMLKKMPAPDIINKILLPAMQKVGDMFGAGEMVLPFVLQSAEVMRTAVDILAPHMENIKVKERGIMVLATVRGDVHDIGKNLVDIILTNNGYKVVNLGVKQTADSILKAVEREKPSAIGLSGLLVQSCFVMKDDLAELKRRGINLPVICGGAALTRKYVENDLQKVYQGKVYYAKDAFEGLKIMGIISKSQ